MLAALFKYLEILRAKVAQLESQNNLEDFAFYNEIKAMCGHGFAFYKIPEPMDHVCDLAGELIFTRDVTRVLKDIYPDVVLEDGFCTKQVLLSLLQ